MDTFFFRNSLTHLQDQGDAELNRAQRPHTRSSIDITVEPPVRAPRSSTH